MTWKSYLIIFAIVLVAVFAHDFAQKKIDEAKLKKA